MCDRNYQLLKGYVWGDIYLRCFIVSPQEYYNVSKTLGSSEESLHCIVLSGDIWSRESCPGGCLLSIICVCVCDMPVA